MLVAVDTETTGLNSWVGARPFTVSYHFEDGTQGCVYWKVDPFTRQVKPRKKDIKWLRSFLEDESYTKVFHNAKFDIRMLETIGITVEGEIHDTAYLARILNTSEWKVELKYLAKRYLEINDDDEKTLKEEIRKARREAKKKGWAIADSVSEDYWLASRKTLERYAILDAERTFYLFKLLSSILEDDTYGQKTYAREMLYHYMTYDIESRGMRIYPHKVHRAIKSHLQRIAELEQDLTSGPTKGINLRSSQQIAAYLFSYKKVKDEDGRFVWKKCKEGLGLEVQGWTDGGAPSTAVNHLIKLSHPWVQKLIEYQSKHRELSNFFYKYRDLMVKDSLGFWCLHCELRQVTAITGRYSSALPNLQNLPDESHTRTLTKMQAREPFGPRDGYVWLLFDWSQLEVRIFADLSKEPTLLRAMREGRKIHVETCNAIWGGDSPRAIRAAKELLDTTSTKKATKLLEQFDGDIVAAESSLGRETFKTRAKTLTFLTIYGGGPVAASEQLQIPLDVAEQLHADYFDAFPSMSEFMDRVTRKGRRLGYVTTNYGRKIIVDPEKAYRGVNYRVQGSAADLVKDRMYAVWKWLKLYHELDGHIVMQVHDEIIIEMPVNLATMKVCKKIASILEDHKGYFGVPLPVELEKVDTYWPNKKSVNL